MEYSYYSVGNCDNMDVWKVFLGVLQVYSDSFSLIFYKHKPNERDCMRTSRIKKKLRPYLLDQRETTIWPGTEILTLNHGETYQIATYRCNVEMWNALEIMERVGTLWDWDYPLPMDLCFYKNGRCLFASSAHERWNALFLSEDQDFLSENDLLSFGLTLRIEGKIAEKDVFVNPAWQS